MKRIIPMFLVALILCSCNSISKIKDYERNSFTTDTQSKPADIKPVRSQSYLVNTDGKTIEDRFIVPQGFERINTGDGSYEKYIASFPLKPHGSKVKYYNGEVKSKDVYEAVLDIDVGDRDLQQCADAAIRLRAEYLYSQKQYDRIHFNFTNGFKADYSKWMNGYRISVNGNNVIWNKTAEYSSNYQVFRSYLDMVFAYAGTLSLLQEMKQIEVDDMQIGDVFLDKSHTVIIVDIAKNKVTGKKLFILAQSYMPAQDIQILKNMQNPSLSPWYPLDFGETLTTPEWTFTKNDMHRFVN